MHAGLRNILGTATPSAVVGIRGIWQVFEGKWKWESRSVAGDCSVEECALAVADRLPLHRSPLKAVRLELWRSCKTQLSTVQHRLLADCCFFFWFNCCVSDALVPIDSNSSVYTLEIVAIHANDELLNCWTSFKVYSTDLLLFLTKLPRSSIAFLFYYVFRSQIDKNLKLADGIE